MIVNNNMDGRSFKGNYKMENLTGCSEVKQKNQIIVFFGGVYIR